MSSASGATSILSVNPMSKIKPAPRITALYSGINYPFKKQIQDILNKDINSYTTSKQVIADMNILLKYTNPTAAKDKTGKAMVRNGVYTCQSSPRTSPVTVKVMEFLVGNKAKVINIAGTPLEFFGQQCIPSTAKPKFAAPQAGGADEMMEVATTDVVTNLKQMGGQSYPTATLYQSQTPSLANLIANLNVIQKNINPATFQTVIDGNKAVKDEQTAIINDINANKQEIIDELKKREVARVEKVVKDIDAIITRHESDKSKVTESFDAFNTAKAELEQLYTDAKAKLDELDALYIEFTQSGMGGGARHMRRKSRTASRRRSQSRKGKKRGTRKH